MLLNHFDGGLSSRVDPSLILDNEAVEYTNIDNSALVLKSCKGHTNQNITVQGYIYNFKDLWFSSALERSYIEYKDFLYYTEDGQVPKKHDGFRETNLGIIAPTMKITATQANPVASEKISASSSVLQYTYTFYNSQDGIESAPAPISDELSLAADKVVDLTAFSVSTDLQVDKIKIYRIGDGTTTMTLVKTVANAAATIRDDILTLDLPGNLLDTENNQAPPFGLKYLTEAYGTLFGALGDKLYYNITGKPNYWPAFQYIDFARDITGILPVPNGILIHSRTKTDILIGSSIADFAVLPVSTEQGSIAHLSGKQVKTYPVWASTDGICVYINGGIEVLSKDKLGKRSLDIINAAVIDEHYYLNLADGSLLAMDVRFGRVFKEFKHTTKIDNILVADDILYARIGDKLYTLFTGNSIEFTYTSPVFTEAAHATTKMYNNIYVRSDGDFTFKVYVSGVLIHTQELTGNTIHDILPPQEHQRGSSIQIKITGIGTIYEIDYKVIGRQNGR